MSTAQAPLSPLQLTPFGLVRTTGTPFQVADLIHKYSVDPTFWGTAVTGTGAITHEPLMSGARILAGAAVGTALLQSHEFWHYQAGCSTRWKLTIMSTDSGNANSVREWGYTDFADGLYFRHARNTVGNYLDIVEVSTSGAATPRVVAQSAWNQDKMDGTGPGGTLNPAMQNIYEIDFEWLGAGIVRYVINGRLVHIIDHTNTYAAPYMRTGQLPTSIRVVDAGSAGASGVVQVCNAVHIEGGAEPMQYGFAYERSAGFALTNAEQPIMSLRPANLIGAIANRTHILPSILHLNTGNFAAGATLCTLRFYLNKPIVLPTWVAVAGGSNAERDEVGTIAAGGTLFAITIMVQNDNIELDMTSFFTARGRKMMRRDLAATTLDILTITGQLNAGTGTFQGGFVWGETT
jgi:hypothetical protein